MPRCIEWGEERHQECERTEDQGYNECAREEDRGYADCCTWWPCNWLCDAWVWISNVVCVSWTWMSNVVCVSWTWISTAACVAWDFVVTIVSAILTTIESILGWILSGVAAIIELILSIPGLGTVLRWLLNLVTFLVVSMVAVGDLILGAVGIRPEKTLRICPVILRDENGEQTAEVEGVVAVLQLAADVFKRDANIRLIPSRPFNYSTGFEGAPQVDESWIHIDSRSSPTEVLDAGDSVANEFGIVGSILQMKMTSLCFYGAWRRITGFGAPITVFFIRNTLPNSSGRSLWITDYVFVNGNTTEIFTSGLQRNARTAAHEIAHSCSLWHECIDNDPTNLMGVSGSCDPVGTLAADTDNPILYDWQALLMRGSKHVSYF